jgi:hypothetical protein
MLVFFFKKKKKLNRIVIQFETSQMFICPSVEQLLFFIHQNQKSLIDSNLLQPAFSFASMIGTGK